MRSCSSTEAVAFIASQDSYSFSWWMPNFIQAVATFEIFLRPATLDKDHTARSAVRSFTQGIPQQSQRVEMRYLHYLAFGAFYSKNDGHAIILQSALNKAMHIYNGNVTLRLRWNGEDIHAVREIKLSKLIARDEHATRHDISTLLRYRTSCSDGYSFISTQDLGASAQTTPPTPSTHRSRTGRRHQLRDAAGQIHFYKTPKNISPCTHPQLNRINRIQTCTPSRAPPPRGTPGAILADEECTPQEGEITTQSRGATRRRLRRRLYRQWCRLCRQQQVSGAGSRSPFPLQPKKATPNRAKWFRQSILWQTKIVRKKKRRANNSPTTPPMPYASKFRVGSLNVQGFADTLKLKNSLQIMQEHRLDVLILTETKSMSYYSYTSEEHLVVLSGNHKDKYAGVGAIISPRIRPHLMDIIQVNPRIIHLAFKKKGGNIHVVGAYAPHSKRDLEVDRQPFWDTLEEYVSKIPQPEPLYLTGDFNVRFQASHKNDEGVLGPFVYGKGARFIDHTATSNRSLCVTTMKSLNMVEAASYLTPNMNQQITHKDKAAPPTSWSQFVLDPLIMQQLYSKLHYMSADTIEVASIIRAYVMEDDLLPPDRLDPHPDPIRFQRLDHTFVRQQWLSSVNSCRSKLHTGFPSDHYLLVTEVQVKLAKRDRATPTQRKYDFSQIDISQRYKFNQHLKQALGLIKIEEPEALADHTAAATFYTDGSGTGGRCTSATPAGWGWTCPKEDGWIDARGPVITQSDHTAYIGASVGSNNTGELTAIAEAILYAIERDIGKIHIYSDSQWSINVVTGKWRPKTHHKLINYIRNLISLHKQVHLQWIKSHVGHEGNERADKLANEGRLMAEAVGGRQHAAPIGRRRDTQTTPLVDTLPAAMLDAAQQTFRLFQAAFSNSMDFAGNAGRLSKGKSSGGRGSRGR